LVLADQAATSSQEQAENAPNSKTNYATAFFDSIGQNRKSSTRAYVFRFAPESGHCST
jgi:hypothetical protein